jgi:two-component system chemotaxis response regulator CheB
MDYEMPMMDGITAVRHIMQRCPTPVLMFSSLTHEGARVTLDALDAGAVDFLPKNFEDISRNPEKVKQLLCEKILSISRSNRRQHLQCPAPVAARPRHPHHQARQQLRQQRACASGTGPIPLVLRTRLRRRRPSARPTNWSPSAPPPAARLRCSGY